MISAKNIYKSYKGKAILKNVSIAIKQGEVTVLFGPSGSGKTTLLRTLGLLEKPDRGEIFILGNSYKFPSPIKNHVVPYPRITVVFQQLFLWPNLTNRQNILLAFDVSDKKYDHTLNLLNTLIQQMSMEDYIDRLPGECSLGQRQRVAIGRALIHEPEIILFDEITASLDVYQITRIIKIISELKLKGLCILFITHNISVAKKIGDHFAFMVNGRIIEQGTKNIFDRPKSKELHDFLEIF